MNASPLKENLKKFTQTDRCPVRNIISRFSGKWAMLVLCVLDANEATRFSEIGHALPDISPKIGIRGNFHFLIQELNNDVIARLVTDWLAKNGLAQ